MPSTTTNTESPELRRFDGSEGSRVVGPADGKHVDLRSLGVRFMVWAEESGGGFALVEHPIPPRTLCAPLHRHSREDEYSYVLRGRMGARLGETVVHAGPGDLVFKPRGQWHTFWNAGDEECRILEIISPGGFEHFFDDIATAIAAAASGDPEATATLNSHDKRYGIEIDLESVPRLCEEHNLTFPA